MKTIIQKLINAAEADGLTVVMNSDECYKRTLFKTVLDCHGFISFGGRVIHIAPNDDDYIIMITLLHECGHWLGMKRSYKRYGHYSFQNVTHLKEADAYKYGWYIAKYLNAPITKQDWREAHQHEIVEYVKREGKKPIFTPRKTVSSPLTLVDKAVIGVAIGYVTMIIWVIVNIIQFTI